MGKYNDTWRVAYNAHQQWYFTSDMDSKRAYCFQIPSCAHTSFSLPGEDVAQQLYTFLGDLASAIQRHDHTAFSKSVEAAVAYCKKIEHNMGWASMEKEWTLPLRAGVR